jgi:outer membrane protein TolC
MSARSAGRFALTVLLGTALIAADRPAVPAKLTLADAMEIAFRSSQALVRAAAQLQQAEGQSAQARSPLLPQVSLGVAETLQTVNLRAMGIDLPFAPSRVGPFQTVDARASLTQNVLNLSVREQNRAGLEQVRSMNELAINARELLAHQVAVAFAQALRAQSAVLTLSQQVELSRKLLETSEQRFGAGAASRLDLTRSRQQVLALEQSLSEARSSLTAAKLQLTNLLHAQVTEGFELVEAPVGSSAVSREQALADGLQSRGDYRALQSQLRAAEHRLAAVKAQRYPSIQFRADYGQSGRKPFENLNTFRIQGVLNMPLFTGGRIEGEQVEAEGRLAELNAQLEQVRSQIEMEVLSAYAQYEAAVREMEVAGQVVVLAREELGLAEERFVGGVADNTEVVNAQDRLTRAEDSRVRAVHRRDVALADLLRSTGSAERGYRVGK